MPSDACEVFRLLSHRLKPHEIGNFQQAINLKHGHDCYTEFELKFLRHRKRLGELGADKGQPLSEVAKIFFNECVDFDPSEIYTRMNEYLNDRIQTVAAFMGIKFHLVEVVFEVGYEMGDVSNDLDPYFWFDVYALVKAEVDVATGYKLWIKGKGKPAAVERCSGRYHVFGGESFEYNANGDGFDEPLLALTRFPGFIDNFTNYKEEWDRNWDCPFSILADGTVRQRRFAKTADGRTTFLLHDGSPYDPVGKSSLENPDNE